MPYVVIGSRIAPRSRGAKRIGTTPLAKASRTARVLHARVRRELDGSEPNLRRRRPGVGQAGRCDEGPKHELRGRKPRISAACIPFSNEHEPLSFGPRRPGRRAWPWSGATVNASTGFVFRQGKSGPIFLCNDCRGYGWAYMLEHVQAPEAERAADGEEVRSADR